MYASSIDHGGFAIFVFEKLDSGLWGYLGKLSPKINLPVLEAVAVPFMAYDYSYFYFSAYDLDAIEEQGIYRAKIICDINP